MIIRIIIRITKEENDNDYDVKNNVLHVWQNWGTKDDNQGWNDNYDGYDSNFDDNDDKKCQKKQTQLNIYQF